MTDFEPRRDERGGQPGWSAGVLATSRGNGTGGARRRKPGPSTPDSSASDSSASDSSASGPSTPEPVPFEAEPLERGPAAEPRGGRRAGGPTANGTPNGTPNGRVTGAVGSGTTGRKATASDTTASDTTGTATTSSDTTSSDTTSREPVVGEAGARTGEAAGGGSAAGEPGRPPAAVIGGVEPDIWDQRVAGALAFLRRRLTGDYDVDEFGFDRELTEAVFHPALRVLYRDWFRVEVRGMENLPADGAALIVANHSGTIALDALMLSLAVHDEHPERRYLRLLGADLVFRMPFISEIARKHGGTLACNPDAERLLRNGELVGVFPEGFKGVGKLYRDRYRLQRFGRGGFVSAALRTTVPIIPVSIVGAEEIYPMLGNIKPLARLLGTPYFPVTPTFPWLGPLGLIPLPSKWFIEFGPPIDTAPMASEADDPLVVLNVADQVREAIQQNLYTLLALRDAALSAGSSRT